MVEKTQNNNLYAQIPVLLLKSKKVSTTEKVIYALLHSYCPQKDLKKSPQAFPSHKTLAEDLGINKTTIIRSLKNLEKKKWIIVKRRGQGKSNVYTLKVDGEG